MRSTFSLSAIQANWKSGLTVSLISIPLSISLAVASGVSPLAGIITAIWAGLVAGLFGGSSYNIIGPTGALSGIIASYALVQGPAQVPALAIASGFFIVLASLCAVERYLIFIPSSVIHGFTLGVACIISLSQLNFALGLKGIAKHEKFIENVAESLKHFGETSLQAALCCALSFIALVIVRKKLPSIPGPLIISFFGIVLGYAGYAGYLPVRLETLASTYGSIKPSVILMPSSLAIDQQLVSASLVIAFIAIIETMLSAKIADAMTKTKHDPRREILGLGFANIVSGLVGGIPATAALARTALNIKAGATSNLSAILSSIGIVFGSFTFLSSFSYIPMPVIAAILIYIAVNMIERQHFVRLLQHDKGNFVISLLVGAVTVVLDPIIGILAGSVLALLVLVNKLAASFYEVAVHETKAFQKMSMEDARKKNVLIYTFKGKLVYLNSQAHLKRFQEDFSHYAAIILALNDLYFIDSDGVDALEEIIELSKNRDQKIVIIQPSLHIINMLHASEEFQALEQQGLLFESVSQALNFFELKPRR